jgi:hypothetical protein
LQTKSRFPNGEKTYHFGSVALQPSLVDVVKSMAISRLPHSSKVFYAWISPACAILRPLTEN